jgi:hypothetical protein
MAVMPLNFGKYKDDGWMCKISRRHITDRQWYQEELLMERGVKKSIWSGVVAPASFAAISNIWHRRLSNYPVHFGRIEWYTGRIRMKSGYCAF